MTKVAFVGTGDVFLRHYLPEAMSHEAIEVTAICDNAGDRAEQAADFLGDGVEAYTDYGELLERSDAEIVVIVTPPTSHYELTLAGLEAGKNIYVEKPFCRHLEEANHLIETAERVGVQLMAAPTSLLDPAVDIMRTLIADGAIGKGAYSTVSANSLGDAEPTYYERFLQVTKESGIDVLRKEEEKTDPSWYFQRGGGPLYDGGVYAITRITGLLGPARRVVALSGIVDSHRRVLKGTAYEKRIAVTEDDLTMALLDFGESCFVHLNTGWIGPTNPGLGRPAGPFPAAPSADPSGIVGMEGTIVGGRDRVRLYRNETQEWEEFPVEGRRWEIPVGLTHFAECLAEGMKPRITIEHARHVVEIMEKIYVAARTGEAQDITTTF